MSKSNVGEERLKKLFKKYLDQTTRELTRDQKINFLADLLVKLGSSIGSAMDGFQFWKVGLKIKLIKKKLQEI